jgi:hypothetical protein
MAHLPRNAADMPVNIFARNLRLAADSGMVGFSRFRGRPKLRPPAAEHLSSVRKMRRSVE